MAIKIDFVSDVSQVVRGVGQLGDALDAAADDLAQLDRAGTEAGRGLGQIERGAEQAERSLDAAERAMRDTGDAADKINTGMRDAGSDFERVTEGIEKDAEAMSKNVEQAFRNMADKARANGTKKVADDTDQDMHRASESVETFKDEAKQNLSETASSFDGSLDSLVDGIQGTLGGVASSLGPAGMIGGALAGAALGAGVAAAQSFADGINDNGELAAELAQQIRDAGGALSESDFVARMDEWGMKIQDQREWWELWQDTAQTGFEDVREASDRAGVSFKEMFQGATGSLDDAKTALDEVNARIDALYEKNGVMWRGTEEYEQIKGLKDLRDQLEDNIAVQEQAEQIEKDRAEAIGVTTDQLLAQVDAQDKLSDAMSDSVGSQLDYLDTLDEVNEKIGKNGAVHGTATKEARDNERALIDLKDAAYDMAAAQLEAGESTETVSGQLAQQRADFIRSAEAMGYTTSEANGLADAYGLIPANVITDVSAKGVDATKAKLNGIERNIPVVVDVRTAGVDAARRAMAAIPRTLTTTVRVNRVGGGGGAQAAW